ncbi:MAG: NAD-dependent deacylase [Desulfobacterales bacterium]|nr:NAD-dependent deacylase [Desulfobacterales bacterium]MCP4158577.1 NAD-dependent deacylase [Deltaproteobacteria bacterium]
MKIDFTRYDRIVFFTGAGMSAESNIPTYRGSGGIWHQYNYEEYACQIAFDNNPEKVLDFHKIRRKAVLECSPHSGHKAIAVFEKSRDGVSIVTQNIDGMHQQAGSIDVTELHGSLFRVRCRNHGIHEDLGEFTEYKCSCGNYLRPDIIWFGDSLVSEVVEKAVSLISNCDLFISIGTSGVVWPAAGFPELAKKNGARCIEINPELSEMSYLYEKTIEGKAGDVLTRFLI